MMRPDPRPVSEAPDLSRGALGGPGRPGFLAFIADEGSEAALRGGLVDLLGGNMTIRRGDVATAARTLEREPTPHVLVVDITGVSDPIAALEKLAAVCTPDVRLLAVGERSDIGFYRQMTRDTEQARTGPGGQAGATLQSSAADPNPEVNTSEQSLPGPAAHHPRTPNPDTA